MCLSKSPGGMRRAPGTICAEPLNACSLLRSITRTSGWLRGEQSLQFRNLDARDGVVAHEPTPLVQLPRDKGQDGGASQQSDRSLRTHHVRKDTSAVHDSRHHGCCRPGDRRGAVDGGELTGGMRRIPASGATIRLRPGMNLAAATVIAGRRRKRRSARPTHASGLSDSRQSSPSTRRPWIRPKAYQARSPIQKPHALASTSGTAENRCSAARLPASNSKGTPVRGAPRLSSERSGADNRQTVSEKKGQHYFAVGISVTFT